MMVEDDEELSFYDFTAEMADVLIERGTDPRELAASLRESAERKRQAGKHDQAEAFERVAREIDMPSSSRH